MVNQEPKYDIFHRQIRDFIFKVFYYFEPEAESSGPVCNVAKSQEHAVLIISIVMCDIQVEDLQHCNPVALS